MMCSNLKKLQKRENSSLNYLSGCLIQLASEETLWNCKYYNRNDGGNNNPKCGILFPKHFDCHQPKQNYDKCFIVSHIPAKRHTCPPLIKCIFLNNRAKYQTSNNQYNKCKYCQKLDGTETK